jgi:methyl-accepting chemotaxis protein
VRDLTQAQSDIGGHTQAVQSVGDEVGAAAQQITQGALQTRLVAFNASVEAKRARKAGRGFGVVVKEAAAPITVAGRH